MTERNAPPCTVSDDGTKNAEGMTELIAVARFLRAKLDELISGEDSTDPGMRAILEIVAPQLRSSKCSSSTTRFRKPRPAAAITHCLHTCPQHLSPLDPAIWSCLPEEVLEVVFAKLPVPEIHSLRYLSTRWKQNLVERSRFRELCPKMFAMVSNTLNYPNRSISVKLYDIQANRWHSHVHQLGGDFYMIATLYAGDGGLVCVLSMDTPSQETPSIRVFNPLHPGRNRVLPPDALRNLQFLMVQLVMDRDRRCYKVLVVGVKTDGDVVAKIFSSKTGAWDGEISEGLVFGQELTGNTVFVNDARVGPCAYDFVERQLLKLDDDSHPCHERAYVRLGDNYPSQWCYALLKDHLFVLDEETYDAGFDSDGDEFESKRYCISEYQGHKCEPHWVKLRTHSCREFERFPSLRSYKMRLYACNSFLLVIAANHEPDAYEHVLSWLYDMATEKWQAIPPLGDKLRLYPVFHSMFELQWDAVP